MRFLPTVLMCAAVMWPSAPAHAQSTGPDLTTLSLEELGHLRVETVAAASKFAQEVTRAPASITVITKEEIRKFGHRTVSDVLRSVRGLYVTYDRNYSYLGVRGFSRPGDYNGRVLVLVDGHRLNDPIYDQSPMGTDVPVDVELIDRIEVIRGPGSSLYGTNAFLATINIVTQRGHDAPGLRVEGAAGSQSTRGARASFGRLFGNGADLLLSVSAFDTDGASRLYFPEFDAIDGGFAHGLDGDSAVRMHATAAVGQVTIHATHAVRDKTVPTAAFGTVFGDDRLRTTDIYDYVDVTWDARIGGWATTLRGGFDRYHYDGTYPFESGDGTSVMSDIGRSDWVSSELTVNRRITPRHHVTAGAETRYAFRQQQYASDESAIYTDDSRRSGTWGVYAQDEFSVVPWLLLHGGLRVDRYGTFGPHVTPRAGAILLPSPGTAIKIMHGRAFRAPNAYELYFYSNATARSTRINPETVLTSEVAWEQYYGQRVRSAVTVFESRIRDLISQKSAVDDTGMFPLYFANDSGAIARGAEAEIEGRWSAAAIRVSHAYARARDQASGAWLSNSPEHLTRASAMVNVGKWSVLGFESQFTGARQSVYGTSLKSAFIQNATLTLQPTPAFEAGVSLYNLLDREYQDPGAEEHVQPGIPQDGRTLRVRASIRF